MFKKKEVISLKKNLITIVRLLFLGLFLFLIIKGRMQIWLIIFAISLIVALLFGRVFCGYICPMNTIMRPVNWLARKLKWQTTNKPRAIGSGWLAIVLLAISIPLMLAAKRVLQKDIPVLIIFLILSAVITLRYRPEVFHNLLCPFGVLQKITGRFALYGENVEASACTGCHKCEKVCPSEAVYVDASTRKATINSALCHQCQDCAMTCPFDAISYRRIAKK